MTDQAICDAARECLRQALAAESENRSLALEDIRFRNGEQWPTNIRNGRELEQRPCLTINKLDSFVRQVTNNQRQNRPQIKVHPVDDGADVKIAKVIQGLMRHIEVNSDAENAYDTAFDSAVTGGWGYWRVHHDYVREDSFDQDIFIQRIRNPFTVYFDPNSTLPDGSDAEWAIVTDMIPKATFRQQYPKAEEQDYGAEGAGDSKAQWSDKDNIRVAEFFRVEKKADTLCALSNGRHAFRSDLPEELFDITITRERPSFKRVVKWYKLTAFEVLESKEWAGRYIPIVPCYGVETDIDGKVTRSGMVRNAKDPQRMYNYWRTTETELIALAPKAPYIVADGQLEGFEAQWQQANVKSYPYLTYKPVNAMGQSVAAPMRQPMGGIPAGAVNAAQSAEMDIKSTTGIFDAGIGNNRDSDMSGRALQGWKAQSDNSNFHFFDNLARSIKHTGRIILDLIPKIYDTERVTRIIGEDGKPDLVIVNEKQKNEMGAVVRVLNDLTIGTYDVTIDTGPGYETKRLEASDMMMQLAQHVPQVGQVGADLIVRNMDWPGADILADRLAAANPLAKVDEASDVPPQVQMQIAHGKQLIEHLQQQLAQAQQELQNRAGMKHMELQTRLQEKHLDSEVKLEIAQMQDETYRRDVAMRTATQLHDTEVQSATKKDVEEIKGYIALLMAQLQPTPAMEHAANE